MRLVKKIYNKKLFQSIALVKLFKPIVNQMLEKHGLTQDDLSQMYKLGFTPGIYAFLDLEKWAADQYFMDQDFIRNVVSQTNVATVFEDKRHLPLIFRHHHHFLPSLNIAIKNSKVQYVMEDGEYREGCFDVNELLSKMLNKYDGLIYKPHSLWGGEGIFTTSRMSKEKAIERMLSMKDGIINNLLINEEYARIINPSSLNTMRVYFFKRKNGELGIFRLAHRFGSSHDVCVDNSENRIGSAIDLKTGIIVGAHFREKKRVNIDVHPVTKQKINGVTIPEWGYKLKQINEIIELIHYSDFGNLDIAFTTEGVKLIEINTNSQLDLMECWEPALIDDEFVEFLRIRGYERS